MAAFARWLLVATAANAALGEAVTPIAKVLQMIEEMKATGIAEKKAEEVRFSEFRQFCTDTSAEKTKAIEESALRIERLSAEIAKAEAEIAEMQSRVAELEEDVGRWEKDSQAATDVRQKERMDYDATHTDYAETISAVERAVEVIKEMPNKVPQALVQTPVERVARSPRVPGPARKALLSFLEEVSKKQDPRLSYEAPEAYAYESQSGGVMEMLQELHTKFVAEMTALEKEEMIARHAYTSLVQRMKEQTELAEQEVSQKKKHTAERQGDLAEATGAKAEEEKKKAKDEEYLVQLKQLCAQKETDFAARQKLRAEEIEALSKAIDIISSNSVAADRLPGGSEAAAPALAQLARAAPRPAALGRVAALLHERAAATGSRTLALAAQKAAEDPFEKVKKMIRDLITRLMEEANEEANHKGWCDAELATNKLTRTNKAEAVDQLAAEVEKLTVTKMDLTQQIADLTDEMAKLDKRMAEATEDRQKENAENEQTIADAKMSQTAVAQALAVLREFYAKAAEATALVQQTPAEDAPDTFSGAYKGLQGESTGVVGMLEVIESDFARLDVETTTAEDMAAQGYKKFIAEAEEDKAVAQAEVDHKNTKLEATEQVLASTQRSLEQTQDELDAALKYYEKLKPTCVDSGISWEVRIKRRQEEMQSLKEAYKILTGEDVPSFQDMKAEMIGTL